MTNILSHLHVRIMKLMKCHPHWNTSYPARIALWNEVFIYDLRIWVQVQIFYMFFFGIVLFVFFRPPKSNCNIECYFVLNVMGELTLGLVKFVFFSF